MPGGDADGVTSDLGLRLCFECPGALPGYCRAGARVPARQLNADKEIAVAMAEGPHPFPYRTR